jgi:hypothetical protein
MANYVLSVGTKPSAKPSAPSRKPPCARAGAQLGGGARWRVGSATSCVRERRVRPAASAPGSAGVALSATRIDAGASVRTAITHQLVFHRRLGRDAGSGLPGSPLAADLGVWCRSGPRWRITPGARWAGEKQRAACALRRSGSLLLRRRRDLNPREGITLNPLSRRAPSTGLGDASSAHPTAMRRRPRLSGQPVRQQSGARWPSWGRVSFPCNLTESTGVGTDVNQGGRVGV